MASTSIHQAGREPPIVAANSYNLTEIIPLPSTSGTTVLAYYALYVYAVVVHPRKEVGPKRHQLSYSGRRRDGAWKWCREWSSQRPDRAGDSGHGGDDDRAIAPYTLTTSMAP